MHRITGLDTTPIQMMDNSIKTPALVYDSSPVRKRNECSLLIEPRINLLFPVKSCSISDVLINIASFVEGFACSSLFEAKLAREITADSETVHFTSPGLRPDEIDEVADLCDAISFNSLSQLERFRDQVDGKCQVGLRVNTELSFVADKRYDPSRLPSKLGVLLSALRGLLEAKSERMRGLSGILIHSNCESEDFTQLLKTVQHVERQVPELLEQIEWINLGGGYLFDETTDWGPFEESVNLLSEKYKLQIFFEPGKAIIGEAGIIVSSVVDITKSGDKKIAILDTTVNHMPEVFEFQYRPEIKEESESGRYIYILAGATCLAGDVFGEYRFDSPLEIGSRITFLDMGAYTLVKAHWFNGIGLPSVYLLRESGELELIKEYGFEDYLSHCGALKNVTV